MLFACCLAFTPRFPSRIWTVCIGCHADEDAEAGLDLASLVERNDALAR